MNRSTRPGGGVKTHQLQRLQAPNENARRRVAGALRSRGSLAALARTIKTSLAVFYETGSSLEPIS